MSTELVPCASCARHVRSAERLCPFCGVVRVTRDALLVLGTSVVLGVAMAGDAHADPRIDEVDVMRADLETGRAPRPLMVQYGAPPPMPEPEPEPPVDPKPPVRRGPIRRNGPPR